MFIMLKTELRLTTVRGSSANLPDNTCPLKIFGVLNVVMVEVGRNEPCPCGSQKKYKKCCGAKLSLHHYSYSKPSTKKSKATIQRIIGMVSQAIRKIKPKDLDEKQKVFPDNITAQSLQKNQKNKEEPFS